jgi:glycosyltransferase involved in cell wall biosynthesis
LKKLHVHIIYEHGSDLKPFGVAHIRDILPLTHPTNAEAFHVTYSTDYARADVVIAERMWKPCVTEEQALQVVEKAHQDKAALVYSIDDNLLDLAGIPTESRMVVRYFCRTANAILVSTDYLRQRLQHLNQMIFVLPNAIDERLFTQDGARLQPGRNSTTAKVIGFMGTLTHDADLMMALQALRRTLRKHIGRLEVQLIGAISNHAVIAAFQGLPVHLLHIEPHDVAYLNFVLWMRKNLVWDIGIAPLENTRFTRGKSDIKFLDYSALGITGIYSRVPCYESTVQHLENGCLVENTPAAWGEALEMLLEDQSLRLRLATAAQDYVFSTRTLQHCAKGWREAILSVV